MKRYNLLNVYFLATNNKRIRIYQILFKVSCLVKDAAPQRAASGSDNFLGKKAMTRLPVSVAASFLRALAFSWFAFLTLNDLVLVETLADDFFGFPDEMIGFGS